MHMSCSLLKAQSRVISHVLIFCVEDGECVIELKEKKNPVPIVFPFGETPRRECMYLWSVFWGVFWGCFLGVRCIVEVLQSLLISGGHS